MMGKIKKLCWTDADVKCPFYVADSRAARSISCEGYALGTDVVSRFRSLAARERHMGVYCVSRYEECPLYRCVYAGKYGEKA